MGKRLVSTSIRLYARLPLYGPIGKGPMFYPAAALPLAAINKIHYERWAGGWGVGASGDSLVLLKELLPSGSGRMYDDGLYSGSTRIGLHSAYKLRGNKTTLP
ncbi:hypothetical protein FRC12_010948, partial [Ceratobasidium sp. 428]